MFELIKKVTREENQKRQILRNAGFRQIGQRCLPTLPPAVTLGTELEIEVLERTQCQKVMEIEWNKVADC